VLAAALKAYHLASTPTLETSLFTSRAFGIFHVEFELVFALWLWSGAFRRWARLAAIGVFTLYLTVSAYQYLSGAASCGCFGRFELNPFWPGLFDLIAITALIICRPPQLSVAGPGPNSLRIRVLTSAAALSGLAAAIWMANYTPATLAADGNIAGDDKTVLLEPEKWIGQRFPLLVHIDIGHELANGEWEVILYHRDCPLCARLISQKEEEAEDSIAGSRRRRIAFVEVPVQGSTQKELAFGSNFCERGRLSADRSWFVKTPVTIAIEDGVVYRTF
jgi:hypothetical protein